MSAALRDATWDELELGAPYAALPDRLAPDDTEILVRGLARVEDKNAYMAEVFDHTADTLPPSRAALSARLGDPRLAAAPRLFHRLGACAKVRMTGSRGSPYTGLLAEGVVVHGIARASLPSSRVFAPGMGFKWFVARPPTVNLLVNHSFEGFDERDGFFAERMRTVLDPPRTTLFSNLEAKAAAQAAVGFFMGALAWWQRNATETPPNPLAIDLTPLCSVTPHGAAVLPVSHPDLLVLHGDRDANRAYNRSTGDFRARLGAVLLGPLFTVVDARQVEVARIELDGPFVASVGGDTRLFFHHPFSR